jgi:hypothetical protein
MIPHERALEAAKAAFFKNYDPGLGVEDAISAYLEAIGGVVCSKEPSGFGVERMGEIVGFIPGSDPDAEYRLPEDKLPRIPLHAPIEAGNGDGWLDSTSGIMASEADRDLLVRRVAYAIDDARESGTDAERQRNAEIMEEVRKVLEPLIGVADLEDSHYALDAVMVELDRLRAVRALLLKLGGGNG